MLTMGSHITQHSPCKQVHMHLPPI